MEVAQVIVSALLRAALYSLSGMLIERHILTPEQGEQAVTQMLHIALLALPGLGAWIWSLRNKYHMHDKVVTALAMPKGSTLGELHDEMEDRKRQNSYVGSSDR